ncbi:MAG: YHYH protein, partial [Pseudomonadota bacterium]
SGRQNRSRDPSSGWRLDGMGAADALGMDQNDAHVDDRGLYHYHGVSAALRGVVQGTLLGYAADGFEIHYDGRQRSSYRLKSGTRPSGPGGRHDGTYEQDWEYVAGSGTLDACNGGTKDGRFVYYATTTYPFFPRCLYGSISGDFR